jgi:two-component system, cell cycle sensor histidine kinase and response regulator CckA
MNPRTPDEKTGAPEVQSSELHYRRLFEAAQDGILILDATTGQIADANPALLELLGGSKEQIIGTSLGGTGLFKDRALAASALAVLQKEGCLRYDNLPVDTKDGRQIEVEFVSNVYYVGPQRVIQCNIRNVTERRHLETKLQQAQKMEAMSQLAGGVAHGYNNSLTTILLQLGLLLDDQSVPEETRASLRQLEAEANRAADLTRQLMTFSRRQVIHRKPVDLNRVLAAQVKTLQRLMGKHITIEFADEVEPLWVEADVRMIEQVVTNLYVNAWDAMMPNGGRLTIEASRVELDEAAARANPESRPGTFVCLSVADTGRGMDANTLKRSFDPFFTTKEVGKAAGLGLTIVYGIAKQHEGWVEVSSQPSRGTVFRVFFPALAKAETPPSDLLVAGTPRGRETILVVEDEAAVRGMVILGLQLYGYRVLGAGSGEEALRLWENHAGEIDLLFSDMRMPGLTGMELYDRLKRDKSTLRVIISSGHNEELLKSERHASPEMVFLPKPYGMKTLGITVRRCLDRI